jgi:ubiquinone/menaquinone biosynthesis C-methylase UbiE
MSASTTREKWDAAARGFDFINSRGPEQRWAPVKRELYSAMAGKVLFLAVGTGLDIQSFPAGQDIVGIDISPRMLEKAAPRAAAYDGRMELREMDAQHLDFPGGSFDQVYTACTFCSVPDPVKGLRELRHVLKPGGELRMFEHTGSRWFPYNALLHMMNPIARKFGPEVIRDTVGNVEKAGFQVVQVRNIYLDIVRTIFAVSPR